MHSSARRFGGKLEYKLPAGAQLVSMTWRDADLWVLYYDPKTQRCVFVDSSELGYREGQVVAPDYRPVTGALPSF